MKTLLWLTLFFLGIGVTKAQYSTFVDFAKWEEKTKPKISTKQQYLEEATAVLLQVNATGFFTTTDSLIQILSNYQKTAWSDKKFRTNRVYYFEFLMGNSTRQGKIGEAIFYSEKYNEALFENEKKEDIVAIGLSQNYLGRFDNSDMVIEIFEKNEKYIRDLIKNGRDESYTHAIRVFFPTIQAYYFKGNKKKVKEILDLARSFKEDRLANHAEIRNYYKIILMILEYKYYSIEEKNDDALKSLEAAHTFLNENKAIFVSTYDAFDNMIKGLKLEHYLKVNNHEKVLDLLEVKYEKDDLKEFKLSTRSSIEAKTGNYNVAYELLKEAVKLKDKRFSDVSKELNDLLYAQAEANYNREALEEEKKMKERRLLITVIISVTALSIIISLISRRKKEKKIFEKEVEILNLTSDIQIQEAIKRSAVEEQMKIGQNLHDGMTGSLATALKRVERIQKKSEDSALAGNLEDLHDLLEEIYNNVRNKSHQLYDSEEEFGNLETLEENIEKIASFVLAETDIKVDIEIDKSAASRLNNQQRLELFRIVLESLNNIQKHAVEATEVHIFLFEIENNFILLQISDNGKKINSKQNKKGIGLKSLDQRVSNLNGNIVITQEEDGFFIEITIPYK